MPSAQFRDLPKHAQITCERLENSTTLPATFLVIPCA
jgi:hypothetical protein